MIAKTLAEAIGNLAIDQPLIFEPRTELPPGADPSYYEDRDRNPRERIITELTAGAGYEKVLLVGPRGAGKSTELNKIAADDRILRRFLVVKTAAGELLDLNDMSYVDLLFAMTAQAFKVANRAGTPLPRALLQRLDDWRATIETSIVVTDEAEAAVTARLSAWFLDALGKLRTSHETRKAMRVTMEPQVTKLVELLNDVLDAIRQRSPGHDVLFLVDDTEKCPEAVAHQVFVASGVLLSAPRCKVLLSFPIDLHASPEYRNIENNIGRAWVLPNLHVLDRDGHEDPHAVAHFESAARRRLSDAFVAPAALHRACLSSGGGVREFFRLLLDAAVVALTDKRDRIATDDVAEAEAEAEIRGYYIGFLKDPHFAALVKVRDTQRPGADEAFPDLLRSGAVLRYRNGEPWLGLHPLVKDLVERWQRERTPVPVTPGIG